MKERHYTREHHYKGPLEVWVEGAQRFEAETHLTGRESVEEIQTSAEWNPWSYRQHGMVGSVGWPRRTSGAYKLTESSN